MGYDDCGYWIVGMVVVVVWLDLNCVCDGVLYFLCWWYCGDVLLLV